MLKIFDRKNSTDNDPFCGVNLGDEARDTLTGFKGVVVGRSEHLTGCNQVFILPKSESTNEIKAGEWLDIERIEKITERAVQITARRTGADIPRPHTSGARLPQSK